MNDEKQMEDLYSEIVGHDKVTVFVTPPIRFGYKQSDYLYLLYKELFRKDQFRFKSINRWRHVIPVIASIRNKPVILHHHWLECTGIFDLIIFFYTLPCLILYKWTGGKLVWTVHNIMPLDCKYKRINYSVRRWLATNADLLHIQCRSAIPEIAFFYRVPEDKFRFIPHPKYPAELMPRASAVEAINHRFEASIKMQDRLFLMIGHISAYKQIEQVCEIFIHQPIQKKLVIAGPVKKGQMKHFKKLKKMINGVENIIIIPRFISEDSVPEFLNASDYVIFNFSENLTSGVVHLALSYKKPVIVPDTLCMRELNRTEMIYFSSQQQLGEIIDEL